MDPIKKVRPGERLQIPARAWNRVLDTLGPNLGYAAGATAGVDRASNIVLVQNGNIALPMHGVCCLEHGSNSFNGATLDGTDAASVILRRFIENPIFQAAPLVQIGAPFGIALEPIAAQKVGRVAIGGSVVVRVNLSNTTHRFADIKENDNTQLQSTSCGPVRILILEASAGLGTKWAFGVM